MPVKPEREYRSAFEFEIKEQDSFIVEGYATTFDVPYELEGYDGEKEVILKSALDEADMSDVILQYDHNGMVYARTRNNTLTLLPDDHGLHIRSDLSSTQASKDMADAIRTGLVDRMSWGFMVAPDGWEYDPTTRTSTITKITKVYDVSAVSIPANQGTEIHTRSAFLDGAIEEAKQELLERRSLAVVRLSLKAKSIGLAKGMNHGVYRNGGTSLSRS